MRRAIGLVTGTTGIAAGCLTLMLGAMTLGTRAPGSSPVAVQGIVAGPSGFVDPGAPSRFAPLRIETLRAILGDRETELLLGDGARTAPPPPDPGPLPDEEGRKPGELTRPDEIAAPAELRIDMTSSHSEATPGDRITYTITVTNVGEGAAKDVSVTSHVPEHTTFVAGQECEGETVKVEDNPNVPGGKSTCVSVPVAGPPRGGHAVWNQVGILNPGQRTVTTFTVAVDADTPQGTRITNHGHVSSRDVEQMTSNRVSTRVR